MPILQTRDFEVRLSGLEPRNQRVRVKFDLVSNTGLLEGHVIATTTSGYAFTSYGAALKGARRALAHVAKTGRFPNMCERF